MTQKWEEVGSWNVGQPCGSIEKFILERNSNSGSFRLKNDFGNIQIDLDIMSGIEFLKNVLEALEGEIEKDIDEWLKSVNTHDIFCTSFDSDLFVKQTIDFGKD